jgi:small subunit ribosomal protein S1
MTDEGQWKQVPDEGFWNARLGTQTNRIRSRFDAMPSSESGWTRAEASYTRGDTLELRVIGYNRGGVLVDLGDVRGFVPASQLTTLPRALSEDIRMQALAQYVGISLRLKVIEFDRARNRLVLSERIANPPPSRADQLLATIKPHDVRQGVVRNVTDFGAFVDLGGIEGLIHVSEISWQYVAHPRDVLSPGQTVDVYVMEINREQKRIACSLKQLKPNPWDQIAAQVRPGDWIDGVVTGIVAFGVFVRVAEGVEGLLHISELGEGNFLHPHNVVQEGQTVHVRVMDIEPTQQRLHLSLRQSNSRGNGHEPPPNNNLPPPLDPGYWQSLAESGE